MEIMRSKVKSEEFYRVMVILTFHGWPSLSHSRFMVTELLVAEHQRKKKRNTNMCKDNLLRFCELR